MATVTTKESGVRRLNFILSERAYGELSALSKESRRSMTELIRYGVGLMKLALEAQRNGQKLMVVAEDGRVVKELVLPS